MMVPDVMLFEYSPVPLTNDKSAAEEEEEAAYVTDSVSFLRALINSNSTD